MYKSPAHKAAEAVVRSMGVTCVNISMRQFIYALELLHQEPDMIHSITTKLHPALLAFLSRFDHGRHGTESALGQG